jgi:hypothetical protein
MRTKALWVALALAFLAMGAAEPAAEPKTDAAAVPGVKVTKPGDTVSMVELTLSGRTVEGRLVYEDDKIIRIEPIGTGTIGYALNTIRGIRRFSIPASEFDERCGEYYQDHAWTANDPPAEFVRARQAYNRALLAATDDEARTRVKAKMEILTADRNEWQQEALREQDLELGRHQIDLVVLERQLTKQKIDALARQEQQIQDLQDAVRRIEDDAQTLAGTVDDLQADVLDMADEVGNLQNLDDIYVRNDTFADLRRAHEALEREVQRLNRALGIR